MTAASIQDAPVCQSTPSYPHRLAYHDNPATATWFLIGADDKVIAATGKPGDCVSTYPQACQWAAERLKTALGIHTAVGNVWERIPEEVPGQVRFSPTELLKVRYIVEIYVNHEDMVGFAVSCDDMQEVEKLTADILHRRRTIKPTIRYHTGLLNGEGDYEIFPAHITGIKVKPQYSPL